MRNPVEPHQRHRRRAHGLGDRERERLASQGVEEPLARIVATLDLDEHAGAVVANEPAQFMAVRQCVDEWPESDALHDAVTRTEYLTTRCDSRAD
ncbi:MAG: hypothetical protein U0163_16585 [Gemmatimonadaceae bacterium]